MFVNDIQMNASLKKLQIFSQMKYHLNLKYQFKDYKYC